MVIFQPKPPSFSELSVIGCLLMLLAAAYAGAALYVCIRTGFANPQADLLLLAGVLALAGLWALWRWASR